MEYLMEYYWHIVIGASLLGIIPTYIAYNNEERDPATWWALGTIFFILVLALLVLFLRRVVIIIAL